MRKRRQSADEEYAETLIAQSVSTVDGVAQVQVFGGQKYAVRVQVDPQAMATRQIGIDDVNDAFDAMRAGTAVRSVVVNR